MSFSKELPNECVDIKVHYDYHGRERCGLIDINYGELYGLRYDAFVDMLQSNIPHLSRYSVLRLSFLDEENTYIDFGPRNFHRFLKLATHSFKSDVPKINIKIQEGSSPMCSKGASEVTSHESKRCLPFEDQEYKKEFTYRSPVEIEIDLKKREISAKKFELEHVQREYDSKWQEFNPVPAAFTDTTRTVCTRCHLRLGHTKNRCTMAACESATICGQVERHPIEKKQLQELSKKKQKTEGELKALESELGLKEKVSREACQTFEAKVHDILIRTNPSKYLTDSKRPKEGIILGDSFIIKKYYGNTNPSKAELERDSDIFQTVIKSYEEKLISKKVPKNCVEKELELQGVHNSNSVQNPWFMQPCPSLLYSPVQGFGWNQSVMPTFLGSVPSVMNQCYPPACASPPPPLPEENNPPLPPETEEECDV